MEEFRHTSPQNSPAGGRVFTNDEEKGGCCQCHGTVPLNKKLTRNGRRPRIYKGESYQLKPPVLYGGRGWGACQDTRVRGKDPKACERTFRRERGAKK